MPEKCFYSTLENIDEKNKNEKKIYTTYDDMADGTCYKKYKDKVQLDYSNLIELVAIDVYLKEREKYEDNKDLFLLELDFEDPECIALLEFVGKGNYGVVKKGLTFENGELVTKAIKFTCSNDKFENSTKENILKEVLAGKIINEIGVGNKIAFVQDYMTINEFIKRSFCNINGKIVYLKNEESKKGDLKNAVDTTFLNKNLETLPSGKTNVYKDFENNVFNKNGKIDRTLYIMFMDIVNGEDLFLNEKKREVDIDRLGDMLFDVLNNLYVNRVALKDIKPKNIIWDKKNNKFSIIDVQTLGQVGRNLTDSCGTPELWPFFKTLNLNLESKNESKNEIKNESKNEIKDNKIKDNDGKDNLYDLFCNSIDDNFVDIYAACMTMYFAKFSTYTAAGLLTLLFKWLVLDEENKKKEGWETVPLNDKIEFLQKYNDNYKKYIKFVNKKRNNETINENLNNDKNKNNINEINIKEDECSEIIKFFFENIDDRNLSNIQKNTLADSLKKVIFSKNESDIFYLLKEKEKKEEEKKELEDRKKKEKKKKEEEKKELEDRKKKEKKKKEEETDEKKIITFYKKCIEKDFKNFKTLYDNRYKYADVIKYVLCYGSCLNYNGENKEMDVNTILQNLKLNQNIEIQDKEFLGNINNVNVIDNLRSGFNQKFIIDLLGILPLGEYNKILEHGVNKDSVNYYFKSKIDSLKENEKDKKDKKDEKDEKDKKDEKDEKDKKDKKDKKDEIEKQKKVFYLLRFLEINKLFHIPKNILKISSLINENTKIN